MPADFSHYLLVTDLDGTLVNETMTILPKDIEALQRFVEGGGRFAVSTGRAMVSALPFVHQLPHNAPCVFLNGGAVMDPVSGEFHLQQFLPPQARDYVRELLRQFPNMRAAVLRDNNYYNITERHDGLKPFALDGVETVEADLEQLPGPWYKILFNVMDHPMEEVQRYALSRSYQDVQFVPTTVFYYEMMPAGISKASGVRRLVEIAREEHRRLVAIGDFYNDLEMIKMADLGVTVANAPKDLQAQADLVVCSVAEGALCQLIDYLATHDVQIFRGANPDCGSLREV